MSSTSLSSETQSGTIQRKHVGQFKKDDLQLLRSAHSSSCSINKIVEGNFLRKDLLDNIDKFISSIEAKLDRIEALFDTKDGKTLKDDDESIATLQNLYDTLITIKNTVFTSSINLENFNKVIDEHYGNLFDSIASSENLGFHEKLLTGLHFIDAKINQFNDLVESEAKSFLGEEYFINQVEKEEEEDPAIAINAFKIKFHNYEHAMEKGCKRLLHYHELPFPWRENRYIIHGYRFQNNHLYALKSICCVHNETSNIWTHLLGAMLFIYIALYSFPRSNLFQKSTFQDNFIFYIFLLASIKCLLSSSFWHTFNGTSNLYLKKKFACIDYTGITVLITASVITSVYASLYYMPVLRTVFILFSMICGLIGFTMNWSPKFDRPESRPIRIAFFIALAALGAFAFLVLVFQKGFIHAAKFYSPLLKSFGGYLSGVAFYGTLFPECLRSDVVVDDAVPSEEFMKYGDESNDLDSYFKDSPKKTKNYGSFTSLWWVDYICSSHNIWHLCVLLGVYGHYCGIYEMFENIPLNK